MGSMPLEFVGLTPVAVEARVSLAASTAAGARVVVHVGEDVFGCRNVGVDLPRARRSAAETRALRQRVRDALERIGVILAESALAPRVMGDVRGSVRVRDVAPTRADASHMLMPSRR